jgi:hypothetical protein
LSYSRRPYCLERILCRMHPPVNGKSRLALVNNRGTIPKTFGLEAATLRGYLSRACQSRRREILPVGAGRAEFLE